MMLTRFFRPLTLVVFLGAACIGCTEPNLSGKNTSSSDLGTQTQTSDSDIAGATDSEVGGMTGGMTGGERGGINGGMTGGTAGGESGGTTGGESGGTTGGMTGGESGGINGGMTGGTAGGESGGTTGGESGGTTGETGGQRVIEDSGYQSNTQEQLNEFYLEYGGRDAFPNQHRQAIEGMLLAEDALITGDLTTAGEQIETIFTEQPRSDPRWYLGAASGTGGSNTGHPIGYYGLRMMEQIVALGTPSRQGTLHMTGVVATCAIARRPRVSDLQPEVVEVQLEPEILENNARRLFLATQLFRRWVQAITGGLEIHLRIVVMEGCSTVNFTDNGSTIVSYPDAQAMIDTVSADIANQTDMWWVVTPSGTVGEEEEVERHFITGGMGLSDDGRPLFLSDDLWFVRKFNHMGRGRWTEAEVRTYHPQWFQHEFMHHLYRTWPEFELEATGHQWFDRTTWPEDFQGRYEPDYYTESINRRFLTATPSLADGLQAPNFSGVDTLSLDTLVGTYRREPVLNPWHEVTVLSGDDGLRWLNAAGVSWSLNVEGSELQTGEDCPYGVQVIRIQTEDNTIRALWFGGEAYRRID